MLTGYYRTSDLGTVPRQALHAQGVPDEAIFTDFRRHHSVELYRAVGILEAGDTVVLHSVWDLGPLPGDIERFVEWVRRRQVNVRIGNYLFDLADDLGVLMLRTLVSATQLLHATQRNAS
ncbi:hypothetical protein ACIQTT_10560 [Microbacterium sp. NPDC090225]|uniref:hypothetical protein n=1 Tax=Microbacterium sp. NPDC090225 TaxID=3364207 RepID=UPI00381C8886